MKRILSFTLVLTMMFVMLSNTVSAVTVDNDVVKIDNANPLIASMKFDNNLKDDANQENLKANGNYSYVDAILPGTKALHLESGDDNYVGTTQSLKFGNDSFTTSFWYKGDTNNRQVIVSNKDFTKGSNEGWAIYTSANSVEMNFGFPTAAVKNISFGRDTFNASDWRYVTFVVDREKMLGLLYIDGYKMAETTLGPGSLDTSNPLNIGSDGLGKNGGNSFDIADLNIWKGALSSDVVQANYNSYGVNKVDMNALNDTISEANTIVADGLGNGFSETDFDHLKKVLNTATTVATTQKVKLYTQETINYYERELNNALFIYQKSNKTLTPAGLNMIVDSDPEISSNPASHARIEKDYRTELRLFPQADVLFIPGDVTGGNNANEYVWMSELTKIHTKLTNEGLLNNTKFYMVRGNHDMGGAEQFIPVGSAGAWNESTNSYDNNFFNSAYRVKVKGYNIVGFDGNFNNDNTVKKTNNFLDQIRKEEDYDPTKPIFVSSHYPIGGTVWSSRWSSAASNNVGKYIADNNFSQVVYMSGHTQYDPTDERSHYQGSATYLDSGASSYSSYIDEGPYGGYIEGSYINYKTTPRIVNFIEVYGSKIIIKQYNLSTDEYVGIPSVKIVGEGKDAFTYNKSDIRELIAPQFDEGITVDSYKNNELAFTIKQANDNVRVLEYNIQLINKLTGKVDKSFNSLSLPLDKPFGEYRQYKFTDLSPTTPYILRVFAADSMYNRSSQDIDITAQDVNLNSITAPADLTGVAIATAKTADALGLPKTVSLDTDAGKGDAIVTWDVDASNYDPTVKTVQTFTVNGTVTLPTGVANPSNVSLATSIKVTVNKIPQSQMTATATSEETIGENSAASMAIDGNPQTVWHTKWDKSDVLPQSITLNLGGTYNINNVAYLPRPSGSNGNITGYNVYVSTDGVTFTKVASGTWANDNAEKVATFDSTDASYVKLEATAGTNGWAAAAEINVTISERLASPATTLTGLQQVSSGQTFDVKMGLTGVTQSVYQSVYAQDLTLHYNPVNVQFDSVTSLKDGFQVIEQKETAPGQIRIIASSVEASQGVLAQGDLLNFKFTAKSATDATTISVDNVVIANGQGNELKVNGASHEIQISKTIDKSLLNALITSAQAKYDAAVEGNGHGMYVNGSKAALQSAIAAAKATANDPNATQQQVDSAKAALEAAIQVFDTKKINADVNRDGNISIGDLAIVAAAYGKQQDQAGWNEKADVNKDGKVDIIDLAIVAKAILQ
ncbi:discoidin domain-containing protein [Bacillus sp. FJAT-28004]|uniref:discoidin domain-containing protein n=1 Tax=Bacillus sp. FJAT-28004 TaxID=1679165 RepID=UPI0006B4EFB1|nr:discoidin domain-containing protein [Bacillus sp. FJAT-28004]